jgi:hypothetical protein
MSRPKYSFLCVAAAAAAAAAAPQDLNAAIITLNNACSEVIASSEGGVLNLILGLALLFGNLMNHGASQVGRELCV